MTGGEQANAAGEGSSGEGVWAELLAPAQLLATITVSLGIVLFAFNAFLVGTALPSAVAELGGGALMSWSVSLYLVTAIVTGAATALVMQRIGARRMFFLAALTCLAGTIICGLAPNMPVLLGGRLLQGASSGFIEAGCYVLIPRLFPPRLIPKVFGVEAIAWAVAAFGGPAVAGYLAEAFSWRLSFLSLLPLIVLFLVLVPVVVPRGMDEVAVRRVPVLPLAGLACGMLLVTVASIAPTRLMMAGLLALAAVVFILTVAGDGRRAVQLFPAQAFRLSSVIGLGLWVALLMPLAEAASSVYLVYALQYLWGYSALLAGLVSAIIALSWSATQFLLATWGTARLRRHMIWVGAVLLVAGLAGTALAFQLSSIWLMVASQIVTGMAFGTNWSALSQTLMEQAPAHERDAVSGLLPTVMAAGYGIGAALFGVIANMLHASDPQSPTLLSGMLWLFAAAGIIAIPAAMAAIRMVALLGRPARGAFASGHPA